MKNAIIEIISVFLMIYLVIIFIKQTFKFVLKSLTLVLIFILIKEVISIYLFY